jgi:hypothetical protein
MNIYETLEIESIQLGAPLVQQPNILQLLSNLQVDTDSIAISSELLYQLLSLSKALIQQENSTLADKISGVKLEYERFVAVTDDEAHYRTEHHFVTDPDWPKKNRSASSESELTLSKDEREFLEKLSDWITDGIHNLSPEFKNCLGTETRLSVGLKPLSSPGLESASIDLIIYSKCNCYCNLEGYGDGYRLDNNKCVSCT